MPEGLQSTSTGAGGEGGTGTQSATGSTGNGSNGQQAGQNNGQQQSGTTSPGAGQQQTGTTGQTTTTSQNGQTGQQQSVDVNHQQVQQANGQQQQQQQTETRFEDLPKSVQDEIRSLRSENASRRTAMSAMDKMLNPDKKDGDTVDPDQLRAQAAEQKRENVVLRSAPSMGADADQLLNSVRFTRAIAQLAPTDVDGIKLAITRELELNSAAKVVPAATRSTAGQHGGQQNAPQAVGLEAGIAQAYGGGSTPTRQH